MCQKKRFKYDYDIHKEYVKNSFTQIIGSSNLAYFNAMKYFGFFLMNSTVYHACPIFKAFLNEQVSIN